MSRIIEFFKVIFQLLRTTPKESDVVSKPTDKHESVDEIDARILELDRTIKQLKSRKEDTPTDDVEWESLNNVTEVDIKPVSIFKRYDFGEIVTLSFLKQERIRKEEERIAQLTQDTIEVITKANDYVRQKDLSRANELYALIERNIDEVKDIAVKRKFWRFRDSLTNLREEVRKEEVERQIAILKKQEEERRLREEEERKQREEQERQAALERERQEMEQHEREARAARLHEEERRKKEAENAERQRLDAINSNLKDETAEILEYLDNYGVRWFYHFTDRKNLQSIRRRGGLLSWKYCEDNKIHISNAGGDALSRRLDRRHGLEDYVRVSFCDDHPMAYRCYKDGADLVLLRIAVDVATFEGTIFSDKNATDNDHSKGTTFEDLQNVDICATRRHKVRRTDDYFGPHQAEVLVRTFIPIRYILNIDNPSTMQFGS